MSRFPTRPETERAKGHNSDFYARLLRRNAKSFAVRLVGRVLLLSRFASRRCGILRPGVAKNLPKERCMKINWSKVLVGGVVAGIVMIAIDWINNMYVLGPKSIVELDAFKPGLGASMSSGNGMIWYLILDIVLGITLIWIYAAIRPRFGPGAGTAVKAALPVWVVSGICYYGYLQMGMFSSGLWWSFSVVGLVTLVVGACAGAYFYSEPAA
jgi:hypothetical protein